MPYSELPEGYGWITGCGGNDGWYYNFFAKDEDIGYGLDPKKVIMCKIIRIETQ